MDPLSAADDPAAHDPAADDPAAHDPAADVPPVTDDSGPASPTGDGTVAADGGDHRGDGADGLLIEPEPLDPADIEPNPEALDPAEVALDDAAGAGGPDEQADDTPEADAAGSPDAGGGPAATPSERPGGATGRRGRKSKAGPAPAAAAPKRPANSLDPAEVTRRIGATNADALRYVLSPDPQLSRLSRKVREVLITDIPPVTAGALLGPDALARHFVASAAAGRYRDLFPLWELFRARPDACKPVLAERQRALERARKALTTAVSLGLRGRADRVVADIQQAQGLIWTWLRDALLDDLPAVGRRPQVVAALLQREPGLDIPIPAHPSDQWLAEAAAVRQAGNLPPAFDEVLAGSVGRLPATEATVEMVREHYPERLPELAASIDRLPATVATLALVRQHFPERLDDLVDRIDLGLPEIGSILAWARDHGVAGRVHARVRELVDTTAAADRAEGLAVWQAWRDRGVDVSLPESLQAPTVEGLDMSRPESAMLLKTLVDRGVDIDPQAELDALAARNRQLAEKAYEAFVCAELDVHLPLALEGNPIVRDGTRCRSCQAWMWVRPGHEQRCPRRREEERAPA